jgi:pimeloyl-ACP methyl ester carboxylesterase
VAQRVPQMGETLGKILVKLYNEKKVDPNNIHLIGHSLGSHVSSYAAQYFNDKANKKIGHLTGI